MTGMIVGYFSLMFKQKKWTIFQVISENCQRKLRRVGGGGGGGAFLNTMPNNDAEKGNQSAKFVTKYLGEGKKLI